MFWNTNSVMRVSPNFTENTQFIHVYQLTMIRLLFKLFLDALASLKTMFKIKSLSDSCFQDYKISRVLQSITEYYLVLHSVAECYRVSKRITEYYRVL